MKGKILSGILTMSMMLICTSALAELPNGTGVIDGKGYSVKYINSNPKEFDLEEAKSFLVKLPNGKWIDAKSEKFLEKSDIPEITYTDEEGNTQKYERYDGEILEGEAEYDENGYRVITVKNSEEFSKAIGSNRRIIMKKGIYKLMEMDNRYVHYNTEDNYRIMDIKGVENLIIEGEAPVKEDGNVKYPTKLTVKEKEANTIRFVNGKNITFKNLEVVEKDNIDAWNRSPDIDMYKCEKVTIENVHSKKAIYGISIEGSRDVEIKNSVIDNVKLGALHIYDSNDVRIMNCDIKDTKSHIQVNVRGSLDVLFQGCNFINNKSILGGFAEYESMLMWVGSSSDTEINSGRCLTIKECYFEDNKLDKLFNNYCKGSVKQIDNKYKGNKFKK